MTVTITYDPKLPFLPVKAVCPNCDCFLQADTVEDILSVADNSSGAKKPPVFYVIKCPRCHVYARIDPEIRYYKLLVEKMKSRGEWR